MSVTSPLAGKRLVVVDDEGLIRLQIRKCFQSSEAVIVGEARSAEEGLAVILRERPDLVLMDISLPGMDGLTATRQLLAELPMRVVIMTAYGLEEYRVRAQQAGACGYLVKPLTAARLVAELERCLSLPLSAISGQSGQGAPEMT